MINTLQGTSKIAPTAKDTLEPRPGSGYLMGIRLTREINKSIVRVDVTRMTSPSTHVPSLFDKTDVPSHPFGGLI